MRTTTELTARFALNMNLIGSPELDAFLNDDSEPGSIEYWEAFEREEELRMRGEEGLLDALDFATVPFETVEADLAEELFEQDLAEDRERDHCVCCVTCGRIEDGFIEDFAYLCGQFVCPSCAPKTTEDRIVFRELHYTRALRAWEKRVEKAERFKESLRRAKLLRPDLNWARYDHDPRRIAGFKPVPGWL